MSKPQKLPAFLNSSFRDAIFYSLMVGMGESYLIAYALAVGLGEMQSGLIAVVPLLFGALVQLFSAYGVWLLRSRKHWICLCAVVQALSLIALAQIPGWHLSSAQLELTIFVIACFYWASALSAGPTWNIWIARIIPQEHLLVFFSSRTRIAQLFVFIGLVAAGMVLEFSRSSPHYLAIFSSIFMLSGFCRLGSAYFIIKQNQNDLDADTPPTKMPNIFEKSKDLLLRPKLLTMVGYLFLVNFTVYLAAPFFNPYMLKQLNLGFAEYTALIGASFLARVFANDFFVRLAHTKGVRSLLIFGTFGIMPLPMLWVFSSSFSYLMVLQIISGLVWGSHELGVVLVLLEEHSEKERSLVLTLTNLCNYLGMFFGGIIGAKILNKSSLNANDYYDIFWISTLARCVPIIVLLGIAQKNFKVKARSIYNRILSARVGGGSVTRPILYAQDEEESEKVRKS